MVPVRLLRTEVVWYVILRKRIFSTNSYFLIFQFGTLVHAMEVCVFGYKLKIYLRFRDLELLYLASKE